mgnify:FL=1
MNPPYFLPLVELIPAPFTKPEVATNVRSLMEEIGQSPITLHKESLGFALNRIQYACINEAWNMYKVISLFWNSVLYKDDKGHTQWMPHEVSFNINFYEMSLRNIKLFCWGALKITTVVHLYNKIIHELSFNSTFYEMSLGSEYFCLGAVKPDESIRDKLKKHSFGPKTCVPKLL